MSTYADHDVATTSEQRVRELRHEGVRAALADIDAGDRDTALERMLRSVESQALQSGCGRLVLTRVAS